MTPDRPRLGLRTRAVHSGEAPDPATRASVAFGSYRELAREGIFRLSVGLEDTDDLCADLDRALGR